MHVFSQKRSFKQNYIFLGKGQNVENQNVKSQRVDQKFEKDQNVKSIFKLIRTSKVTKMEVDQNVESDNNLQFDKNVKNQNVKNQNVEKKKKVKNCQKRLSTF